VREASERLCGHVLETPTVPATWLSAHTGAEVWLKLENLQRTGSFKVRGASNKLLRLTAKERQQGVVAASSGNHGLGVAYAGRRLAVAATVFVPSTTPAQKQQAIRSLGAEVSVFGDDCVDTEAHARAVAKASGRVYVSPYNDAEVIAGQGSIGVELLRQLPGLEVVYVALGGGGLLAGVAAWLKAQRPDIEVVACSPAASPAMDECVRQGRVVEVACGPTWSDSTAGGVEPGAITLPLCQRLCDRFLRVEEDAIEAAMVAMLVHEYLLVEGAAAVAVAGCLADADLQGRCAAVLVCGGNLPLPLLRRLLHGSGPGSLPG
jgi:threonine dehydratase